MGELVERFKGYLYDSDINLNERLSSLFISMGIVAAWLGVLICLFSHMSVWGVAATGVVAVGAPVMASLNEYFKRGKDVLGKDIAIGVIVMMPIIWLTTGGTSGGSTLWFVFVLFYLALVTERKKLKEYMLPAVVLQLACFVAESIWPDVILRDMSLMDTYVSQIGSLVVVGVTIFITVMIQKSMYEHEREQRGKTEDFTREFISSVASIIDAKDSYTGSHSKRVAYCASEIARHMGMDAEEVANMHFAGLLHDIGKIAVPDIVLNKREKLTDEEFGLIRRHPLVGGEVLRGLEAIPHVKEGALYHHERYDGRGYPFHMKGEEIPLFSRIICVADCYDAMSTSRVYCRKKTRDEIISEFIRCRGTQFDPYITDIFVSMLMDGFQVEEESGEGIVDPEQSLSRVVQQLTQYVRRNAQTKTPAALSQTDDHSFREEEFGRMYRYVKKLGERFGYHLMRLSVTLDGATDEQLEQSMRDLRKAIEDSTRAVDVCARMDANSFILVMLNALPEHEEIISKRIRARFHVLHPDDAIQISFTIQPDESARVSGTDSESV